MTFRGPKGTAYIYKGKGHDWELEFWPKNPKHKGGKRTFTNSAKQLAITIAKQMTGIFKS